MLFDIFNISPYYLHINYWTGKSVRIFSRKQVISGNFRCYGVYSGVCEYFWSQLVGERLHKVLGQIDLGTSEWAIVALWATCFMAVKWTMKNIGLFYSSFIALAFI